MVSLIFFSAIPFFFQQGSGLDLPFGDLWVGVEGIQLAGRGVLGKFPPIDGVGSPGPVDPCALSPPRPKDQTRQILENLRGASTGHTH